MMLYTVINPAEMWYREKNLKYCYKKVDNCILEGVKYNHGKVCLSRVISTNPKDYLQKDWTIGREMDSKGFF